MATRRLFLHPFRSFSGDAGDNRRHARPLPLVALVFFSAFAAACAAPLSVPTIELPAEVPAEDAQASSSKLRIGAALSASGSGSARATQMKEGIVLAADEINEAGGVGGRPLEVVFADDGSDPSMLVNRVAELIFLQKVLSLLGDISIQSAAASALAERNQVPLLAAAPPQAEATRPGSYVFHACAGPEEQGRLAAAFVVETMGKKRVGLLYPADVPYSAGLASAFRAEARRLGAEALIERPFTPSEAGSAIPILEVMDDRPDVIYTPVEPSFMVKLARTAMIAGISGEMFVGSDAWGSDDFLRESGDALAGAFFFDHWSPDAPWAASRSFVSRYQERFQREPSTLSALSYDATKLLSSAIERACSWSPSPTRGGVRDALSEAHGFSGVTGTFRSLSAGASEKGMVMRRVERGRAVYYAALGPGGRD